MSVGPYTACTVECNAHSVVPRQAFHTLTYAISNRLSKEIHSLVSAPMSLFIASCESIATFLCLVGCFRMSHGKWWRKFLGLMFASDRQIRRPYACSASLGAILPTLDSRTSHILPGVTRPVQGSVGLKPIALQNDRRRA